MVHAKETDSALRVINDQLKEAIAAPKCHQCGCLQQTVEALAGTETSRGELSEVLSRARTVFVPKKYDCLGCQICYPALAANAFAQAWPEVGDGLDLCPSGDPTVRPGWPPLPGDYRVIRYAAPVAVCTLNTGPLAEVIAERKPDGLGIVGTMHTENLGIERIIKNTLANPHIRFLLLCGEDTQQAIGHLPGQTFESLFGNGVDKRGRIIGALGKRPVLKNVAPPEIGAFLEQVELFSMIGEENPDIVADAVRRCAERSPGEYTTPFKQPAVERVQASEDVRLILDTAGYFVAYPDLRTQRLMLEHYTNQGVLNCVIEGSSAGALYNAAIERNLLTRLDHAAYRGESSSTR